MLIISSLKTIGLFSGAFVGYKYGFIYKTQLCTNALFKNYDDLYLQPNFTGDTLPEDIFYNCIGLFSGLLIGYYVYPIMIPTMMYQLYNINKFK